MNLTGLVAAVLDEAASLEALHHVLDHARVAAQEDVGRVRRRSHAPLPLEVASIPQVLQVSGAPRPAGVLLRWPADDRQVREVRTETPEAHELRAIPEVPGMAGSVQHCEPPIATADEVSAQHAHVRGQARAGADERDVLVAGHLVEREHARDLRGQPQSIPWLEGEQPGRQRPGRDQRDVELEVLASHRRRGDGVSAADQLGVQLVRRVLLVRPRPSRSRHREAEDAELTRLELRQLPSVRDDTEDREFWRDLDPLCDDRVELHGPLRAGLGRCVHDEESTIGPLPLRCDTSLGSWVRAGTESERCSRLDRSSVGSLCEGAGLRALESMSQQLKSGSFLGTCRGRRSAAGFVFTESTYAAGLRLPLHSHENAHFCFVVDGVYTERLGRRSFERLHSALVYYPPGVEHSEEHRRPGRHFLVEVGPAALERLGDVGPLRHGPVDLSRDPAVDLVGRLVQEYRRPDPVSPLVMEALGLELLARTWRSKVEAPPRPPDWLVRADAILRARMVDPPALSTLATEVGVHPAHLARSFRRFFACTVGERVRQLRVQWARLELAQGERLLSEIAQACGFADQSHFTRSFKRLTGQTPAEYRRLHRRG